MGYISQVQIDDGAILPVGSSLYGKCQSQADTVNKAVTLSSFDTPDPEPGITIHVCFVNGNTADNITLAVGSKTAVPVSNPGGSFAWSPNSVISFTYDKVGNDEIWQVNDGNVSTVSIEQQFIADSQNAISGQGVAAALNTLGNASTKGTTEQIGSANKNDDTIVPTVGAITEYVDNKVVGITGAMHFKGRTTSSITDQATTTPVTINGEEYTPIAGDVVLSGDSKEYVWVVTNLSTGAGYWELLGDEGSYALKTNTEVVIKTITFNANTPGKLTTQPQSVPNVTNAGSAANFTVVNGVLQIRKGTAPTLGTAITFNSVGAWNEGTAATINTTEQTVIIPDSNE